MASITGLNLLKEVRGQIGHQIVVKQYGDKTVLTKYPDMSGVKPSELQKNNRALFAKAVAYAKKINADPKKKKEYLQKLVPGETVYRYALKEFIAKYKRT